MNKRLLVIILGIFFIGIVIFIIFNVIKTEPPRNIVSNYYKALSENNFEKASSYLIDKDKKTGEQEDAEYFKDYVKSIKVNVIEEKLENDISTVDVRISRIAFEDIFSEYIKEVMADKFSGNEISDEQMKIKQNEFFKRKLKILMLPK